MWTTVSPCQSYNTSGQQHSGIGSTPRGIFLPLASTSQGNSIVLEASVATANKRKKTAVVTNSHAVAIAAAMGAAATAQQASHPQPVCLSVPSPSRGTCRFQCGHHQ